MSGERYRGKERKIAHWVARVTGATALAASMIVPTIQSLESATTSYVADIPDSPAPAVEIQRITGADMEICNLYGVCGTDLGIPFMNANGGTDIIFGDTFDTRLPGVTIAPNGWRSPVVLRSDVPLTPGEPIKFTDAVGVEGYGMAPEIVYNGHNNGYEYSVIPNDGVSFPETGETIISYMSINNWDNNGVSSWETNYAGLAWSEDGENFQRIGPLWENNDANNDPFQMWSMQRDGSMVYIVSVAAGRQKGPMMLMRAPWDKMLDKNAYECYDGQGWGDECMPILEGHFGEPSLRKLTDPDDPHKSIWVLSYLDLSDDIDTPEPDLPRIVTRTAPYIGAPWSEEKVQVGWDQLPFPYGGFIRHDSTPKQLRMMVSTWGPDASGQTRYDVTEFEGTL